MVSARPYSTYYDHVYDNCYYENRQKDKCMERDLTFGGVNIKSGETSLSLSLSLSLSVRERERERDIEGRKTNVLLYIVHSFSCYTKYSVLNKKSLNFKALTSYT